MSHPTLKTAYEMTHRFTVNHVAEACKAAMAALIPDLPTEIGSRLKLQKVVQRHGTDIPEDRREELDLVRRVFVWVGRIGPELVGMEECGVGAMDGDHAVRRGVNVG